MALMIAISCLEGHTYQLCIQLTKLAVVCPTAKMVRGITQQALFPCWSYRNMCCTKLLSIMEIQRGTWLPGKAGKLTHFHLRGRLIDFTPCNTRQFYSSMGATLKSVGAPLAVIGLKTAGSQIGNI